MARQTWREGTREASEKCSEERGEEKARSGGPLWPGKPGPERKGIEDRGTAGGRRWRGINVRTRSGGPLWPGKPGLT